MSVLDKMVRSAARQAKQAVRLSRQASEHTSLDEWVLRDLKDESPAFREVVERPIELVDGKVYEPSADVHDDLFLTAHAPGESKAKVQQDVRPSHRFGRDILERFVATPEHKDTKPYTEGDKIASAIYARAATDAFDELMRSKALEDQAQQSQDLHEQEQQLQATQDAIEDLREKAKKAKENPPPPGPEGSPGGTPGPAPGPGTPGGPGGPGGTIVEDMKALIAQREALAAQLAQDAAKIKPVPATAVQAGVKDAAEKAGEKVEVWGQVAGTDAAQFARTNPDDAMALVDAWMQIPDYKEFCKLLGRMIRDFRSEDSKNVIGGNDNIIGIEQGADLTRILPTELGMLGSPTFKRQFFRGLVDETLLQFETEGVEKVSNGPGILLIDLSGSMGGRKAMEAKAVAVGFVRLMHKRKRDAVVICFNGGIMWEHHFPKREGLDMHVLLDLASLTATGGTTGITAAVQKARHYTDRAAPFKKADVLVATDGQVGFAPAAAEVRDHFARTGVRTKGIAIAHTPDPSGWLMQFCGAAIGVNQLTEATADIVRAVS
jgi:uncharacterized protein with von Willebrand factor type A (vWA) domain